MTQFVKRDEGLLVYGGDAEIRVEFLGQEDPLEKGMATHSSIFARGAWWATVHGSQRVGHD